MRSIETLSRTRCQSFGVQSRRAPRKIRGRQAAAARRLRTEDELTGVGPRCSELARQRVHDLCASHGFDAADNPFGPGVVTRVFGTAVRPVTYGSGPYPRGVGAPDRS